MLMEEDRFHGMLWWLADDVKVGLAAAQHGWLLELRENRWLVDSLQGDLLAAQGSCS